MIKKFAELDNNNIVITIRDYPTEEGWQAPIFLVAISDITKVAAGDIYDGAKFFTPVQTDINRIYRPAFNRERLRLFDETRWAQERHSDFKDLAIDDALNWKAWLTYWQALRNMPAQTGFDAANPAWPVQPQ